MAIMLPMVVTAVFAGSGPKRRPRGRRCELSRSSTMPGCTRTVPHRLRTMRRRYLEKSITSPAPSDSPAMPLPAPRAWSEMCLSAAYCTQVATSAVDRGRTTPSGRIS